MADRGRRRQPTTPWTHRIRWDLLVWGVVAGVGAGVVLGLTGGDWAKGAMLAALVAGACLVLTLLAAMPVKRPGGRHSGDAP